jgi:AcrR family transcriptional regulator
MFQSFGTPFQFCQDVAVKKAAKAGERRDDALSRERIVDAAIELLDAEGEEGLTFRALATRLATGSGAIYWHVANKSELLAAATDAIVARGLTQATTHGKPKKAILAIATFVFDTVDAHPWIGAQLSGLGDGQRAMLQLFERIGRQLEALGVRGSRRFTAASTLIHYIVGVSVQNAANARAHDPPVDRAEFLAATAARWRDLDPDRYPFTRSVAAQLRDHDDRTEFLAGIDLILAGISAEA